MRVLFLTSAPCLPPTHGARIRTHRLAPGLAELGDEVHVLQPWAPGVPWRTCLVDGVQWHAHRLPTNGLALLARDRLLPSLVLHGLSPEAFVRRRLRRLGRFDAVVLEQPSHARWLGAVDANVAVYDAHNVETDYHRGRYGRTGGAGRALARLEAQAVADTDLTIACTPDDAARLRLLYGGAATRTWVVANGADAAHPRRQGDRMRARERLGLRIGADDVVALLLASWSAHNADSLRFLVDEVLPRLPAHHHLLVVGAVRPPRHRRRPSVDPRLHVVGHLPCLDDAAEASDLAVNPCLWGAARSSRWRRTWRGGCRSSRRRSVSAATKSTELPCASLSARTSRRRSPPSSGGPCSVAARGLRPPRCPGARRRSNCAPACRNWSTMRDVVSPWRACAWRSAAGS